MQLTNNITLSKRTTDANPPKKDDKAYDYIRLLSTKVI
jgi:hypothetical protein